MKSSIDEYVPSHVPNAYHDAGYVGVLKELVAEFDANGTHENRTAIPTASLFSRELRFDLSKGFPLGCYRKIFTKAFIHENIWLLNGDTNIKYLQDNGVNIWNEWANEKGDLGPVYGRNWRHWPVQGYPSFISQHIDELTAEDNDNVLNGGSEIDQIANVLWQLRNDPFSRRIVVSAWDPAVLAPPNVKDAPKTLPEKGFAALASCHTLFQFTVSRQPGTARLKLNCKLYMRSSDFFLGCPMNIAGYALLTHMVAAAVDMDVGEFVWSGTDVHLYANQIDEAREVISRELRPSPTLKLSNVPKDLKFPNGIGDMKIEFVDYNPHPTIKKPQVAV